MRLIGKKGDFGRDRIVRIGVEQRLDDRALRLPIDLADEILRALGRDGQEIDLPRAAEANALILDRLQQEGWIYIQV